MQKMIDKAIEESISLHYEMQKLSQLIDEFAEKIARCDTYNRMFVNNNK